MESTQTAWTLRDETHEVNVKVLTPSFCPATWCINHTMTQLRTTGQVRCWLEENQVSTKLIEEVTNILTEYDDWFKQVVLRKATGVNRGFSTNIQG